MDVAKLQVRRERERGFGYVCIFVVNLLALVQVHCRFKKWSPDGIHLSCDQLELTNVEPGLEVTGGLTSG